MTDRLASPWTRQPCKALCGGMIETHTETGIQAWHYVHTEPGDHRPGCVCPGSRTFPRSVALVSCSGPKLGHPDFAFRLYTSPLFVLASRWARDWRNAEGWAILSAKHGIVMPGQVIEPYNTRITRTTAADWSAMVADQIEARWKPEVRLIVLAGADYLGWIQGVPNPVEQPLQGLQIGQRLQWLSAATGTSASVAREPQEVQGELWG